MVGGHGMSEDSALGFLAFLNRLWDGREFRRDRVTTDSVKIVGRRLTVNLMAQPKVLAQLLEVKGGAARGVGAIARFLTCWPQSTMGDRPYKAPAVGMPRLAAFHARLRWLLDHPLPLDDRGGLVPETLRLAPDAFEAWRIYHDNVERQLKEALADCTDIAAKSAENAARIAAVLHVVEHGPAGEIDAATMLAGIRIAAWYLDQTKQGPRYRGSERRGAPGPAAAGMA